MSREIDAAIGAAHEITRQPEVRTAPTSAPTTGPSVRTAAAKGHRVRLRNIDHALEGCLACESGEQRFALQPNQWTIVSDDIYTMLKDKFYKPQPYAVMDWNGDVNKPERKQRVDEYQEYIIEFPEEVE